MQVGIGSVQAVGVFQGPSYPFTVSPRVGFSHVVVPLPLSVSATVS